MSGCLSLKTYCKQTHGGDKGKNNIVRCWPAKIYQNNFNTPYLRFYKSVELFWKYEHQCSSTRSLIQCFDYVGGVICHTVWKSWSQSLSDGAISILEVRLCCEYLPNRSAIETCYQLVPSICCYHGLKMQQIFFAWDSRILHRKLNLNASVF